MWCKSLHSTSQLSQWELTSRRQYEINQYACATLIERPSQNLLCIRLPCRSMTHTRLCCFTKFPSSPRHPQCNTPLSCAGTLAPSGVGIQGTFADGMFQLRQVDPLSQVLARELTGAWDGESSCRRYSMLSPVVDHDHTLGCKSARSPPRVTEPASREGSRESKLIRASANVH